MNRGIILFDGSNFYNKVKSISPNTHLTNYNYIGLAKFVSENTELYRVNYYVGEVRKRFGDKKSHLLYSGQQSLFSNLRAQGICIKKGYLLMSGGVYHEKGVDVQIAADIIYGSLKNMYETCFLISSDTDLLPAIKIALGEGQKIVYVGFEGNMSKALLANCSATIVLNREIVRKFEAL